MSWYMVDYVNFWSPSPRGAQKNLELNVCFFWNRLYFYRPNDAPSVLLMHIDRHKEWEYAWTYNVPVKF